MKTKKNKIKKIKLSKKKGGSNINEYPSNMNTIACNFNEQLSNEDIKLIKRFLESKTDRLSELTKPIIIKLTESRRCQIVDYILSDYTNITNLNPVNLMKLIFIIIEHHIIHFKQLIGLIQQYKFNDIIKYVLDKRLSYLRYI